MVTSDLQPNWRDVVSNLGTYYVQVASEAGNLLPLPQDSYAMTPQYHDAQSSEGKCNFWKQCSIIGKNLDLEEDSLGFKCACITYQLHDFQIFTQL